MSLPLFVLIYGDESRELLIKTELNKTVEDVIRLCLAKVKDVTLDNVILFGLRTQNGHWLRPALTMAKMKELENEFGENLDHLQLRIRFRLPPYKASEIGKLRRPIRYGGEKLYCGSIGEYLFYQTRSDLLNGDIEIAGKFGNAMGIAVVDALRIKSQSHDYKDELQLMPNMKKLLPPKSVSDLSNYNWLNIIRLNRKFIKSLRKAGKQYDFDSISPYFFKDQYLANVEPILHEQDWGEVYKLKPDASELWVHPENGVRLKRKEESEWIKLADFSEFLSITREGAKVQVQFTSLNHMEIELMNTQYCVDLLLCLEGLTSLLVSPHHYFEKFVTWPFILEQTEINAFGPIFRTTAESYLQNDQCLLRRSPEVTNPTSFYLTAKNREGKVTNYHISHVEGGCYTFTSSQVGSPFFNSMAELISHCQQNVKNFPFNINRRVTPYSAGQNRLQVIRASVADHIVYGDDQIPAGKTNFELPFHSMYPQSQINVAEKLKHSKLNGKFVFSCVEAGTIKNDNVGPERTVVIKTLVYNHSSVDQESLRDSYHKSIEFIHSINHPYIVRLIGMITQTGSIILENAQLGSLDGYLQLQCKQTNGLLQNNEHPPECPNDELAIDNVVNSTNSTAYSMQMDSGETASTLLSLSTNNSNASRDSNRTIKKKKRERNWPAWYLEVFWQLGTALDYLQQRDLVHGNLRASNILVFADQIDSSTPVIKLSDPGINTFQYNKLDTKHLTLPPPWKPIECLNGLVSPLLPSVDKWSYATTIVEICNWCQDTSSHLGYPEHFQEFNSQQKEKYFTSQVADIPEWIEELNPQFKRLITQCWSVEPMMRTSFKELLREINLAKQKSRKLDSSLPMPIPAHPSVMDENLSTDTATFADISLIPMRILGQGHFGIVELCSYEPDARRKGYGELVAVKSLRDHMRSPGTLLDFQNEFKMMRKFDHKNIVKLRGLSLPSGRLVMEYIQSGSLLHWLGLKNKQGVQYYSLFDQMLQFACQICQGMEYLHSKKCIHRDLAARNVMVASDDIQRTYMVAKISDFGLSRQIKKDADYYRGNPDAFPVQWYGPECLRDAFFSYGSDVWSFGVTMWEIFSYGKKPQYKVNGQNIKEVIQIFQELAAGRRLEKVLPMTTQIYNIILSCWEFDFEKRPSFSQIFQNISNCDFD